MTTDTHAQARAYAQARLDDRLAAEQLGWLTAHLAGCDDCRRYAAEMDRLAQLLPETFQARWDGVRASRPARRPSTAAPHHSAYPPMIGGTSMLARQKAMNLAGVGLGLGALLVLLLGVAFALQTATTTDSQIPGQAVEPSVVPPLFEPVPMAWTTHVAFGEAIALEGYTLIRHEGGVTVELLWHALDVPAGDYAVGVFAMPDGAQSAIVAQSDSVPVSGSRPTTGWLAGEYLIDTHELPMVLEADMNLVLWVNVYDPATGERLASDPPGGGPFNATSVGSFVAPVFPEGTATPLPFPTDATPVPCVGECTPTPTALCEPVCSELSEQDAQATADMAGTLGWTPTPPGFVPTVTPCQVGCESYWATGTAAALAGATGTPLPAGTEPIYYTVHAGDTLEGIAAFYGLTEQALLDANGLIAGAPLEVGQVLVLPLPVLESPTPPPGATPTPTPSP